MSIYSIYTCGDLRSTKLIELIPDMLSSYTINIAFHANDPSIGMSLTKNISKYKLFTNDVGLFITLTFKDKDYTENIIYDKLLFDKLDVNLGYVYECVMAQMLTVKGNNLFYYTMPSDTSNHLYEIDFLITSKDKYVVHTKDYKWENGINYIPVYMVPFL